MRDSAQPLRGRADPLEIEGRCESGNVPGRDRLFAQEGLIVDDEDEDVPRFVFLAARFSLRLCWAFFLSPFWEPLSLFATIASLDARMRF